jgi:hypothetical protein
MNAEFWRKDSDDTTMNEQSDWTDFLSGRLGLVGIIYGSVVFAAVLALFLMYGAPWESQHDAELSSRQFQSEIQSLTAAQATTQQQLNELTVHEARFEEQVLELQKEMDAVMTKEQQQPK